VMVGMSLSQHAASTAAPGLKRTHALAQHTSVHAPYLGVGRCSLTCACVVSAGPAQYTNQTSIPRCVGDPEQRAGMDDTLPVHVELCTVSSGMHVGLVSHVMCLSFSRTGGCCWPCLHACCSCSGQWHPHEPQDRLQLCWRQERRQHVCGKSNAQGMPCHVYASVSLPAQRCSILQAVSTSNQDWAHDMEHIAQ
jgi:hypothetical protein